MISTTDQKWDDDREKAPTDDRLLVAWLERQAKDFQAQLTQKKLEELLALAAQPRHASGNACIKLCYFIERCRKSKSSHICEISYSHETCLGLFNFFIDWNEKNQNRSMRQVLELLASLIAQHPRKEISTSIKNEILKRTISIIAHQAAQPLVKPAFKSLECFLGKGPACISSQDLIEAFESGSPQRVHSMEPIVGDLLRWDFFISDIFDWMSLPDVSPAAGKCLVTLFGQISGHQQGSQEPKVGHTLSWQRWIRNGLIKTPTALENVKNYLFPPLFKFDRSGSLTFLNDLNKEKPISDLKDGEFNAHSLLQLAALEVGKKAGLVEEPSVVGLKDWSKKSAKTVILREDVIGPLLKHATDTVRSLAFSVLVSSFSSIRPFNAETIIILRSSMGTLYADIDAKFRNEILSNTRHLISRIRGATAYLVREIRSLSFANGSDSTPGLSPSQKNRSQIEELTKLLKSHEDFVQWYLEFLLGELTPTGSYQRHITALKAILLLLASGISERDSKPVDSTAKDNRLNSSAWPFSVSFFTSGAMRLLLDLLMDPFEDVRNNATLVLKLAPREQFRLQQPIEYVEKIVLKPKPLSSSAEPSSLQLLQNFSEVRSPESEGGAFGLLKNFISRADEMANRTGRADYADGLARCYALLYGLSPSTADRFQLVENLLYDLEKATTIAKIDLTRAVGDAPLHGTFAALNFVWESIDNSADCGGYLSKEEDQACARWNSIQARILSNCLSVWLVVKDVLCNDSPEGHLPEDLDETPSIDTKDVLSYSFRAVHESSNLMRTMVSKIRQNWDHGGRILPTEVFLGIGHLAFEQLSNLRHRGAFSTVSLTFARCCQVAQYQNPDSLANFDILETWYKGAKNCIFEQASTTRRSAGIPALITGILSSNSNTPAFEDVFSELVRFARQPVSLTDEDQTNLHQVHAMNCVKEIFKSSALGRKSESHLAECLQLAADSLTSDIWAIRNCGLLLLRSLIDCLFGTSESKAVNEAGWDGRSIRLSYESYPLLPELLLALLDKETAVSTSPSAPRIGTVESVFPALDILRRAGPPSTHRAEIYRCVSMHLGSKIWHMREIAARTICTLMLHKDWLRDVLELMSTTGQSINRLHGVLMAVKFILERRLTLNQRTATDGIVDVASALNSPAIQNPLQRGPPELRASYLEVFNAFAKISLATLRYPSSGGSEAGICTIIENLFPDDCWNDYTSLMNQSLMLNPTLAVSSEMSSSLGIAIVRRGVYISAISKDVVSLQRILKHTAELNADITLAAVECASQAWLISSQDAVLGIAQAYVGLIKVSKSSEVCFAAISQLSQTMDRLFENSKKSTGPDHQFEGHEIRAFNLDILEVQESIKDAKDTPSLSNVQIRISGAIVLLRELSFLHKRPTEKPKRQYLEGWGLLLSTAGESANNFDTRYAAASALATFYGSQYIKEYISRDEWTLPSLLALYDTLNDDDDEIRDLSAITVSRLLGTSLVPLAAGVELAKWISSCMGNSPSFSWNVVRRMTGQTTYEHIHTNYPQIIPAEGQLQTALKNDDSLFVEEEQNLFVDEIREAKLWCMIFEQAGLGNMPDETFDKIWGISHAALSEWVLHGVQALVELLETYDGPLGWSSKPTVFAICMRVIMSARLVLQDHNRVVVQAGGHESAHGLVIRGIEQTVERFIELGHEKKVHERLLFEIEGKYLPFSNI